MKRRDILAALGAAPAALALPRMTSAQAWPTAPIRMVVPYAAGGGIDAVARLVAKAMADDLGQSLVVDNRGGAGGMLGAELVARAAPDGYTVLFAGNPELTITPWLQKASYQPLVDFKPIELVSQSPSVIACMPSLGAANLRNALAAAKKRPGGITVGTPGNGSPMHIAVELLRAQSGLDIVHVPYKGAAPATVALLGGEIAFALVGAPPLLPHIAAGKIQALAVTQPQRSPLLAQVPTIGEAVGLMKDVDFVAWYGLLTPVKAPAQAVERLQRSAAAALAQPAVRERLQALGTDPVAMPAGPFAQRMKNESEQYRQIIQRFQIKAR
ncbi:Bug family tripartite tricarboxylate transporter substrate binding protein [Variovorax sp. tm]|uniref:Bug family tripartite tricarboxylate transporter substrate binding protein n=1 Tax=Variovorax atrisoli TaxID=3394203 RepID=UPI003A7FF9DB